MKADERPEFLRDGSKLRDNRPQTQPQAPAPQISESAPLAWIQERTRVAVGVGATIAGKLIFSEPVRIEGHFRGEVSSSSLVVIDEHGMVEGRVKANRLVVLGELRGDIVGASRVYFGGRARVYGNLSTENLNICEGAYFNGNIKMPGLHLETRSIA